MRQGDILIFFLRANFGAPHCLRQSLLGSKMEVRVAGSSKACLRVLFSSARTVISLRVPPGDPVLDGELQRGS